MKLSVAILGLGLIICEELGVSGVRHEGAGSDLGVKAAAALRDASGKLDDMDEEYSRIIREIIDELSHSGNKQDMRLMEESFNLMMDLVPTSYPQFYRITC